MRVSRGLLGWGLFLVLLGAVPLAVRFGYLDVATVRGAWQLWPLLLVGIGLGLVLSRTRIAFVGSLVVALTFGLIGGSVLAAGWNPSNVGCSVGPGGARGTAFASRSGTLGSNATVELSLSCGELEAATAAGSGWSVVGSDDRGQGPQIDAAAGRLKLESRPRSGIGIVAAGDQWQITLPMDPQLAIDISLNAGSAHLDLAGAHATKVSASVNAGDLRVDLSKAASVGTLDASANAGSMKVRLPAQGITGSLSANVGSLDVCIPDGTAIRFRGNDNPLSGNNFGSRGLQKSGSDWVTPGFDTAGTRVDMSVSINLGSINLNPENGCA